MKSSESFQRYDFPGANEFGDCGDRAVDHHLLPVCVQHFKPGTAFLTRYRLRVEAAIGRVLVLSPAPLAHGERAHRCLWPVVWKPGNYGKSWPAVRAVDK